MEKQGKQVLAALAQVCSLLGADLFVANFLFLFPLF
jgi:hypothetical protein